MLKKPTTFDSKYCLGFIKGIACPHFDEEKERKPFVEDMIKKIK